MPTGKIFSLLGVLGLHLFVVQSPDFAQAKDPEYPTKPITLYIQFGAVGTADIAARGSTEAFSKNLGHPLFLLISQGPEAPTPLWLS